MDFKLIAALVGKIYNNFELRNPLLKKKYPETKTCPLSGA